MRSVCCLLALLLASSGQAQAPELPKNLTSFWRAMLTEGKRLLEAGNKTEAARRLEAFPRDTVYVFVNDAVVPRALRDSYRATTLKCLELWNTALPEHIQFVETGGEDEARVIVWFENSIATQRDPMKLELVCGETFLDRRRNATGWRAEVRVAIYPHGRAGHTHALTNVTHVVTHELGHVLGLEDTDDKQSIMSPDNHNAPCSTKPSDADLAAVKAIRQVVDGWLAMAK